MKYSQAGELYARQVKLEKIEKKTLRAMEYTLQTVASNFSRRTLSRSRILAVMRLRMSLFSSLAAYASAFPYVLWHVASFSVKG
jgi:hypothetical protein